MVEGWGLALYRLVLDEVGAGPGVRLLDVGCGDGRLCRWAADLGATVTGVDTDPRRLVHAGEVAPSARLYRADLHELPLPNGCVTAVTCVQVLMHVTNPLVALREIVRVGAPGAAVALTVWGPARDCAIGVFGDALVPLLGGVPRAAVAGEGARGGGGPPPLGATGRLAKLAGLAGLAVHTERDVRCPFDLADDAAALDAVLGSALGRRAAAVAGPKQVRRAVLAGLAPYRSGAGGYRLENTFRLVVAEVPAGIR